MGGAGGGGTKDAQGRGHSSKAFEEVQNEPSTYLRQRGQAARQAQALAQRGVTGAGEESVRRCGGGGSHRGLQQRRKVG